MVRTEHGFARIYKVYGHSEPEVRGLIEGALKQGGPCAVSLRRRGREVHVLVEMKETDEERARDLTRPVGRQIRRALGDFCYSSKENETMEEAVVRLLVKHGLTVSTAESCTGGLVAAKLVNVAGVSAVFGEGYVTYANKAKRKLLGVKKTTLKEHGAVSEETAREMAAGAAKRAEADVSAVTTGVAGPDGGTPEKPVGLVYIGVSAGGEVTVEKHNFRGTRAEIREQAAVSALDLLRREILRVYR